MNIRLSNFISENKAINDDEIGFRAGYWTTDDIFVLRTMIDCYKKPIFACFVDLSKAFDTVWREALFLKMFNACLS